MQAKWLYLESISVRCPLRFKGDTRWSVMLRQSIGRVFIFFYVHNKTHVSWLEVKSLSLFFGYVHLVTIGHSLIFWSVGPLELPFSLTGIIYLLLLRPSAVLYLLFGGFPHTNSCSIFYSRNSDLHRDLNIETVIDIIKKIRMEAP
jgi:hypothetical protein